MQPQFKSPQVNDEAELLCPKCKSDYLHHYRVDVFERSEDQVCGVHVVVEKGSATTDTAMTGNPSSRRHGLVIHFECEQCLTKSVLKIAQHKGNTLVTFLSKSET